jgi:exopolyphosphatase/guanosine-5'-triphosphate,3'-diphosphate pyrophosphatase
VEEIRNRRVTVKGLHKLRKRLVESDIQARLRLPGMDPRRADLSVAGAVLLDTIVTELGAEEITLCDLALREGIVLDYIRRNQARIRKADRYPDVRRRSVIELAERCNYWPEHAQQVARLALAIFDQTRSEHQLTDREREWLEYGALLHDIGVHISYEKHHRHSYYLVKNGDLRGFEPAEIEVIALVTRYHRQSQPKKTHDGFSGLPPKLRRVVKRLSAMLRLAEGLDRSHAQAIDRIDLFPRDGDYVARLRASGDAELELWAAHRHVQPLEKILKRTIRFELANGERREPHAHAEQTDDPTRVSRKTVRRRGNRRLRKNHAARTPGQVA